MSAELAGRHAAAVDEVWRLVRGGARTVVVDSPPGAGKSTLVRELTGRLVAGGARVPIITQTNDQADDLATALAGELAGELAGGGVTVGRLHSAEHRPPEVVPAGLAYAPKLSTLDGCAVVVATAAKWAFVPADEHTFEVGVIDEAYQMSSAALVRVADLFERLLLVGDPGQLAPFTTADERVVRSVSGWPLDTAAGTVLRNHPDTPVVPLPVSWRLPATAAPLVSAAFYTRPFEAGSAPGERGLVLPPGAGDPYDDVLRTAGQRGWGLLELPEAYLPRTDPAAVAAIATLVARLLAAGASTVDGHPVTAAGVAVGVTHRDQRAYVRAAVDAAVAPLGIPPGTVTVDTANRLQGRQFEVTVAWHPLSGRRDASAFHLEAGRLCVLASRHRQACVVVARAGLAEQLAAYPADEPLWLNADTPQVDGWEANQTFLAHLRAARVPLPA